MMVSGITAGGQHYGFWNPKMKTHVPSMHSFCILLQTAPLCLAVDDHARVTIRNQSQVTIRNQSQVTIRSQSQVTIRNQSQVTIRDQSQVTIRNQSQRDD
jgi:hypothetical protein